MNNEHKLSTHNIGFRQWCLATENSITEVSWSYRIAQMQQPLHSIYWIAQRCLQDLAFSWQFFSSTSVSSGFIMSCNKSNKVNSSPFPRLQRSEMQYKLLGIQTEKQISPQPFSFFLFLFFFFIIPFLLLFIGKSSFLRRPTFSYLVICQISCKKSSYKFFFPISVW